MTKVMFQFGSWSYMATALLYEVADQQVYLGDFFDNQEWLVHFYRYFVNLNVREIEEMIFVRVYVDSSVFCF